MGLWSATGVGVGAIVGGGILALAGTAFTITGPGAMAAFALNGVIALFTAMTFAEMSARFPESGGTYTFAKKVLSIRAAFGVGWVMWFASIVAAVLYAKGFAAFAVIAIDRLWILWLGAPPEWLESREAAVFLALAAAWVYTASLIWRGPGGSQWINAGKVIVFTILILGGLRGLRELPPGEIAGRLKPFFPNGWPGLLQAMGYTFIALQGFDLIAAVGGEIKRPGRNLPRAMLLSLGIALALYLPLLFVTATSGMEPGQSVRAVAAARPEAIIAAGARQYLGAAGYWLVVAAGVLAMLSALYANLLAASRVARLHKSRHTPAAAMLATAFAVTAILLVLPDVAAAGAAASLAFLISFALAHWISRAARERDGGRKAPYETPFFPLVPCAGGAACSGLALFQSFTVPAAGLLVSVWLGLGGFLYWLFLSRRAKVCDASAEAYDPLLVRMRGRSPLILAPVANPANAPAMVALAGVLAPPGAGRVMLLSIVAPPKDLLSGEIPSCLANAQAVLREALAFSFQTGMTPEALTTISPDPWIEIVRIASHYNCESLLLGFSALDEEVMENQVEQLAGAVACDVVILRAPPRWQLAQTRRVLVPVAGRGAHDMLRARLLGSLFRMGAREITFLQILSRQASGPTCRQKQKELAQLARDEAPGPVCSEVTLGGEIGKEIVSRAMNCDLVILGLQRLGGGRRAFGRVARRIIKETPCAVILISQNRQ